MDELAEQDAVAIVLELREAGRSIRAIVDTMNERRISTREGGRWHIAIVQRTLKRYAAVAAH